MVLELRADATFVWDGDDPRFSGTFSISDEDYEARSFTYVSVTYHLFEFNDPEQPEVNVSLSDPRNVHENNFDGGLTDDGLHLVSYWVASWEYPHIDVGLYSYGAGEGSVETFEYANYELGFFAETEGTWTPIPEPTTSALLGLGSLSLVMVRRRYTTA